MFSTGSPTAVPVLAFLVGNAIIGIGVIIVPGMLDAMAHDLQVSIPAAGQIITVGAVVMALGAPLGAAFTSQIDRRRLLTFALGLYVAGGALCALSPDLATLIPIRAFMALGAALFTPQAAATISLLVPPEKRAKAITTIFLGWSIAAVLGMPLGNSIANTIGWRYGFWLLSFSALLVALWVWRVTPPGLKVMRLSAHAWRAVATDKRLISMLAVTLLSSSGQFVVLAYVAPYLKNHIGASVGTFSILMGINGLAGLLGATLVSRHISRIGVGRSVNLALATMAAGLWLWSAQTWLPDSAFMVPITWTLIVLGIMAWGMGSFGSNASQQARLGAHAPDLTSASIALNTSMMYAGQAVGAATGAAIITWHGMALLPWLAASVATLALGLSLAIKRQA